MAHSQPPRTVFITATSSGIGLATATLFHSLGWNVVATMRTPSSAPPSLSKLEREREGSLLITDLDYQDLESIESAVKQATERFGRLDVVVCGGIMDTIRTVLPHLRHSVDPTSCTSTSTIITISSGASFCGLPLASLYASSKFALEGFTESLSYELASQSISVKSVVPYSMVNETGFASRTMGEAVFRRDVPDDVTDEALGAVEEAGARKGHYDEFVQRMGERYGQMMGAESTEKAISAMDVAKKIYEAATDGTDKLRYWVGSGDGGFVRARFESKSDEEYMALMRSFFA